MKKFFLSFIFIFLLLLPKQSLANLGQGQLQLSDQMAYVFIQYIRGKGNKKPSTFYITTDGTDGMYWYCDAGNCQTGSTSRQIQMCESRTNKKCEKFAMRRVITWKNGINTGRGKDSTIKSKWPDDEILAKLSELGFYENDISTDKKKSKTNNTKKKNNDTTVMSDNTIQQLKDLKMLLDDGIITNEEFSAAKKKLLN